MCSGHGKCREDSTCECDKDYYGFDCSLSIPTKTDILSIAKKLQKNGVDENSAEEIYALSPTFFKSSKGAPKINYFLFSKTNENMTLTIESRSNSKLNFIYFIRRTCRCQSRI